MAFRTKPKKCIGDNCKTTQLVVFLTPGIVAHLASDGDSNWTVFNHSHAEMLEELGGAILQWKVPDSEMVAYRSFKPFFPLLDCLMDYQVQLWAVWAIHHVCMKNPTRYCLMLQEEKGVERLQELLDYSCTHEKIKNICAEIISLTNAKTVS